MGVTAPDGAWEAGYCDVGEASLARVEVLSWMELLGVLGEDGISWMLADEGSN